MNRYIVKRFSMISKWIVFDNHSWKTLGDYNSQWIADIHAEYLNG